MTNQKQVQTEIFGGKKEPYRLWFQWLVRGLTTDCVSNAQKKKAEKHYSEWGDVVAYSKKSRGFDKWWDEIGQFVFEAEGVRKPTENDPKTISSLEGNYHIILVPKSYDPSGVAQRVVELLPETERSGRFDYQPGGMWKAQRYHLRVFDKVVVQGKSYREAFIEIVDEDESNAQRQSKSFDRSRAKEHSVSSEDPNHKWGFEFRYRFEGDKVINDEEDRARGRGCRPSLSPRIRCLVYQSKAEAERIIQSVMGMDEGNFQFPPRPEFKVVKAKTKKKATTKQTP